MECHWIEKEDKRMIKKQVLIKTSMILCCYVIVKLVSKFEIPYAYKFLSYVYFEDATNSAFLWLYFSRITSSSKIRKFCEHSLTNILHMHVTLSLITLLITYVGAGTKCCCSVFQTLFFLSKCKKKNSCLAT